MASEGSAKTPRPDLFESGPRGASLINEETKRLSESTRHLAGRALSGEWRRALVDQGLSLASRDDLKDASPEKKYAAGVLLIAQSAPLRIVEGEKIVGSATLKLATGHILPVYLDSTKKTYNSVSHVTPGFADVLKTGYKGLRREISARRLHGDLNASQIDFLEALELCLEAASLWHRRHLELLDALMAKSQEASRAHWQTVRANLERVPENPPASFYEATQSLWFMFSFQRLCGNWPGIGRIDEMLGPYLADDLQKGVLTLAEAREILAHFWIKGCDWITGESGGSGDAQFYQNIVLAGIDAEGRDIVNEVTYLVLDIVEELRISDFPIAVRLNERTPEKLLQRIAEVQRLGGGIVAVYNEPLIIDALVRFGYAEQDARRFANDGCWEIQIPGETCFSYLPFDVLALLQKTLGVTTETPPSAHEDFESLYQAFRRELSVQMETIQKRADLWLAEDYRQAAPSALASLLVKDCIEKARGYYNRGARYTALAPHAGGLADTGNSLLVIKKLVFEDKAYSLKAFVEILRKNWAGHEALRRQILSEFEFFGNDNPEADVMTKRVFDDFLELAWSVKERNGVLRPAGVSTFGRENTWLSQRKAAAHGQLEGETLAPNFGATPGTDTQGPTALIKSHCAMDLKRLPNGTVLDIKIHPKSLEGENGLGALIGLYRVFLKLGGIFMHLDAVDQATLLEAQKNPEKHRNLAVRVSGWCARFVTLNRDWQNMIIRRTLHR